MNSIRKTIFATIAIISAFSQSAKAYACTDFQLPAKDGSIIIGRTMSFDQDLQTRILVHPRQEKVQSTTSEGKPALSWTSKYGYVSTDEFNLDYANDGINEKGLSFGLLWLPGTKYEDTSKFPAQSIINIGDLGAWILGNFETVDQVKTAISKLHIWCPPFPQLNNHVPPLHIALHDASGNSAVIEFIDGKQNIYENPIGVLTNQPEFPQQIANLEKYSQAGEGNQPKSSLTNVSCRQNSSDSDKLSAHIRATANSTDRFIRTTAMLKSAISPQDASSAVNTAEHILNNLDYPMGAGIAQSTNSSVADHNQWALIKDLSNKIMYFRTYRHLALKSIDLKKLDFSPNSKIRAMLIDNDNEISELSASLNKESAQNSSN